MNVKDIKWKKDKYDSIVVQLATEHKSIAIDLDRTLAYFDGWDGIESIGKPIKSVVDRALAKEKEGYTIKIFTARAIDKRCIDPIKNWLKFYDLPNWEITNMKDPSMKEIWDDLAITIGNNTGEILTHK